MDWHTLIFHSYEYDLTVFDGTDSDLKLVSFSRDYFTHLVSLQHVLTIHSIFTSWLQKKSERFLIFFSMLAMGSFHAWTFFSVPLANDCFQNWLGFLDQCLSVMLGEKHLFFKKSVWVWYEMYSTIWVLFQHIVAVPKPFKREKSVLAFGCPGRIYCCTIINCPQRYSKNDEIMCSRNPYLLVSLGDLFLVLY